MDTPRSLTAALLVATFLSGLVAACTPTPTRQTVGEYTDDATITTRVKAALVQDPDVSAAQVNVETYRGVVQLSGFVDSQAAAKRAADVARQVPGVRSVRNDIRTKPSQ